MGDFLVSTVSTIAIFFLARNPCALAQEVQPFR